MCDAELGQPQIATSGQHQDGVDVHVDLPPRAEAVFRCAEFGLCGFVFAAGEEAVGRATAALRTNGRLVSWDAELVERAGALTPPGWLAGRT